jgi:hypothetical protein
MARRFLLYRSASHSALDAPTSESPRHDFVAPFCEENGITGRGKGSEGYRRSAFEEHPALTDSPGFRP